MLADLIVKARGFPARYGLTPKSCAVEATAGTMAALVAIAYAVSYAALLFTGPLSAGLGSAIWSFMAATAIATAVVAVTTTLPPSTSGPRNPTIAVLSVLAADTGLRALSAGGSEAAAVATALMALAIATAVTGLSLAALGLLRLGQAVRFVPFPVVAGFLGASGWLLIAGGVKVAYGAPGQPADTVLSLSGAGTVRVVLAVAFAAAMLLTRSRRASAALLPASFFASAIGIDAVFWLTGAPEHGWYPGGGSLPEPWLPLGPMAATVDWRAIAGSAVEVGAVAGVAAVTLLLDVSALEAQRGAEADMDAEFRWNGLANLLAAPAGGAPVGVAPNTGRLIEEAGGRTRLAGMTTAAVVATVLASGLNLVAYLPTPVLGGLLMLVGVGVMRDAVLSAPGSRSVGDVLLALAIMLSIVKFGYLPGVLLGLVAACIAFAVRYSRVGVIRRHLTRATFAAPVERPAEEKTLLAAEGSRIHVLWLQGFIFFGSSNGVYEAIRARLAGDGSSDARRRWVVLDMSAVSGLDSSAMLSFAKVAAWARRANVGVAMAGLSGAAVQGFASQPFVERGDISIYATRNDALEAAEDALLAEGKGGEATPPLAAFEAWLSGELGAEASRCLLSDGYLERRVLSGGDLICRQDAASDSIELIASGSVAIVLRNAEGGAYRVRRMTGRTVVGEMGFFRQSPRTTSVIAEGDAVVFVMTREGYRRLRLERPEIAGRFLEFIVRQLADRVEFATKEIAGLI